MYSLHKSDNKVIKQYFQNQMKSAILQKNKVY